MATPRKEWVGVSTLAEAAGVSDRTIRRFAGLEKGYAAKISSRRVGPSNRGRVEFYLPAALEQLRRLRERTGSAATREEVASPTLVTVLEEVRALKTEVIALRAELEEADVV